MSEILSQCEKQVVLYSKNHFQKTDMIEDLRAITAETFGIPLESTMFYHIYNHVTRIFLKLYEAKYIQQSMEDFLCGLFKWNTVMNPEDMLAKMLGQISIVMAAGLNLGEADDKFLPTKLKCKSCSKTYEKEEVPSGKDSKGKYICKDCITSFDETKIPNFV